MNFIKRFFESKMLRLALFIFMFFFIFKIIDHILIFFNINQEMGYIYFMWFTVLFLLFVLLPIDRSYFKIFNKVTPATSNTSSSGDNFVKDLTNIGLENFAETFENYKINDIRDFENFEDDQLRRDFKLSEEQIEKLRNFYNNRPSSDTGTSEEYQRF